MVQGCDINIMDIKSSINKSIKLAVPTEEQKRLAKLSHVERIDTLEEDIIKQMVEITNHTYEKCAMELAITNMDMSQAISNIIEGNSAEEWETKQKRSRPEKKTPTSETSDLKSKRSTSKSERGRPVKSSSEDLARDQTDRSKSTRSVRGGSTTSRGGSSTRSVSRGNHVAGRGGISSRGRGGKRQLPPRMDRQRNSQDDSTSRPRLHESSRGGRSNGGSYRHNNRGAKRHDWRSSNGGESEETNYSAEWTSDGGPEWTPDQPETNAAWSNDDTSGWGATTATTAAEDNGWISEKTDSTVTKAVVSEPRSAWPASDTPTSNKPDITKPAWATSEDSSTSHSITQHKRPAYTQAFSNPLSSMLGNSEFATSTSASFPFPFSSQPQSSVSADTRHEQAPGSLLLTADNSTGRKISVEQLFQLHEKSNGTPGVTPIEEDPVVPSSPPTSSTSSTHSGRKGKRAHQRTIPSEPVEMPGCAVASLDVQFGSIQFLDNTDDDIAPSLAKTPASKTDAATSTTPHTADSDSIPGIREVPKEASLPVVDRQQLMTSQSPQSYSTPSSSAMSPHRPPVPQSAAVLHQLSQSPLVSQPAPPPNLPPPNMDNIRNANSLMTSHSLSEDSSVPAAQSNFGIKKSLPPGVYPTSNLGSRGGSLYYGAGESNNNSAASHHSSNQTQSSYNEMARYYNSSNSSSFDVHHHQQQQSSRQTQQSDSGFGGMGQDKSGHYGGQQRGSDQLQQHLVSTAAHQPHHVGAGITSTTAPTGLGTGYPTPLLGYPYHPHPIHYNPNNLYTANYYPHPFNPLNFAAQTQKQAHNVPSYPGANTFGSSETPSPQFGQYEAPEAHSYKDLYAGSAATKHPGSLPHLPAATSANDYTKMMAQVAAQGSDKSLFNMGYMQFPNYIQQYQQQGQSQNPMHPQNTHQRGLDQLQGRSQTGSLATPKHAYWSHR